MGKQLIKKYELDKGKDPQQYGIGFKEIWEIDEKNHEEGLVMSQYAMDGREMISLRGYPNQSLSSGDGSTIYNRFSLAFLSFSNVAAGSSPAVSP